MLSMVSMMSYNLELILKPSIEVRDNLNTRLWLPYLCQYWWYKHYFNI